ncbi:MAG TPA: lysophospholipid acyltransferase family protein [Vicinamibacteria bacterium]
MLRSLALLLFLPPYILLACGFGLIVARIQGSADLLYRLARFGCRTALWIAGTRVQLSGLERLVSDPRNVVLMPNHASNLDAAILFGLIPVDFKAVYKRELDLVPLLRQVLHFAGFVPVNRKERSAAKRAIARAVSSLRDGSAFVIFPEGTRSRSGELGEFKKGAFVAAVAAESRIFPVALSGARELMPRGGFSVRPGTVTVRVLDPIDARAYSYAGRERLRDEVRGRIQAALHGPVSVEGAA